MIVGFASFLLGTILTIAGVTGSTIPSVVQGKPDRAKATTPEGSSTSTPATAGSSPQATTEAQSAKGTKTLDGLPVAAWIAPILLYARAHGWKGKVTSGFRSLAEQTRIYNSGVRPAAVPGTSNHELTAYPGGAVDVTEAPELSAILSKSPFAGVLVWAGEKDPVHFSHPHNGSY